MKETIKKYYKINKKKSNNDPIICLSTSANHNGAIGIIKISLGNYENLSKKLLKLITKKKFIFPRLATFTKIFYKKEEIDEGIIIYYPAPNSYNGETILEIQLHDNKYIINKIIKYVIKKFKKYNMRISKKGEITKRALFNNKIDIISLKKIYNIINRKEKKNKNLFYKETRDTLKKVTNKIYELIMIIENNINFEIENYKIKNNIEKNIINIVNLIKKKNKKISFFFNIKKDINISIIGKSNSGKSSLFNKLLNYKRSVVSKKSGTTINYISEILNFKNLKFKLFDTVGKRKKYKKNELKGFLYSKKIIKKSDLILDLNRKNRKNIKNINIFNKSDKIKKKTLIKNILFISCKTKFGFKNLIKEIKKKIKNIKNIKKNDKFYKEINTITKRLIKIKNNFINKKIFLEELSFKLSYIYNKIIKLFAYSNKKITKEIFKTFCIGK
ncbi:GTPase [Candidatus Vidania fulgoroideorum]